MLTRVTGAQAAAVLASLGPYREMLEPQRQHLLVVLSPGGRGLQSGGHRLGGPARLLHLLRRQRLAAIRCFCRSRKSLPRPTRRICPTRTQRSTTASAWPKGSAPCRSSPTRFWAGRTSAAAQYLVRQLNDHKGSIEIEDLAGANLKAYAEVCGELLARGHARSGDPQVIAGYIGSGDGFRRSDGQLWRRLRRPDGEGLGAVEAVGKGEEAGVKRAGEEPEIPGFRAHLSALSICFRCHRVINLSRSNWTVPSSPFGQGRLLAWRRLDSSVARSIHWSTSVFMAS